ncbi:MAG TPA: hypothetical protein VHL09_11845 [Dehalococcoidia bacterium]|nr:hypothetical protein [Dehalococcoidia bacterium]
MRRVLALLTVLSLLVFSFPVAAGPTEAQIVTWVRGYPQEGTSGCVEYVTQWSDGSFTWTPWACPPGVVARTETATAVRSYPQRAANGCVEFVNQWSDETYTWVPFECPPGVVYYKPPIEPEPTTAVRRPCRLPRRQRARCPSRHQRMPSRSGRRRSHHPHPIRTFPASGSSTSRGPLQATMPPRP